MMQNNISNRFNLKTDADDLETDNNLLNDNTASNDTENNAQDTNAHLFDLETEIKSKLKKKIANVPIWNEYSNEQQNKMISNFVDNQLSNTEISLSQEDKTIIQKDIINSKHEFGALNKLIENEKVESVYVNSSRSIYIEIDNKILNPEISLDKEELKFILNSIKEMAKLNDFNGIKKFKTDNFVITIIGNDICKSGTNIAICKD